MHINVNFLLLAIFHIWFIQTQSWYCRLSVQVVRKCYIHRIYTHVHPDVISFHASGMDTVPLALLLLRRCTLTSARSSACSSLFFSFRLLINLRVTSSHSSGSSIRRNPRQIMMVAARRTTLKITSCFTRSTAREGKVTQLHLSSPRPSHPPHPSHPSMAVCVRLWKPETFSRLPNTTVTLYR